MELDPSHQQLKHQLMAVFDRASRSVDSTHQKTRDMSIVLEEEAKKQDSRLFRLTRRINGAHKPKAKDEESDAENEGDAVPETTQ